MRADPFDATLLIKSVRNGRVSRWMEMADVRHGGGKSFASVVDPSSHA